MGPTSRTNAVQGNETLVFIVACSIHKVSTVKNLQVAISGATYKCPASMLLLECWLLLVGT